MYVPNTSRLGQGTWYLLSGVHSLRIFLEPTNLFFDLHAGWRHWCARMYFKIYISFAANVNYQYCIL